jgi:hypothetical protein
LCDTVRICQTLSQMTVVPLPASPCVRVRLNYLQLDNFDAGSRFFLSYAGSAPSGANCTALASSIAAAWSTHLAASVSNGVALKEVDVLDIATDSGLSGQWTGSEPGTDISGDLPSQVAGNVEFQISRRYRGGKPRMFMPGPSSDAQLDVGHFNAGYINSLNSAMTAFMAEIAALDIGSMGALAHVNLSYYKSFTNITNSSGRERAVPTYRSAALVEPIVGYSTKALMGSQKRRRAATSY